MNFDGIFTPAITPLSSDGQVNYSAFGEVIEYLIESKVHGIVVGGSTGEYYAHTVAERVKIAGRAKDIINGRLPLVVSTGGFELKTLSTLPRGRRSLRQMLLW